MEAALEAYRRLRFAPIVMTSVAFIAGTVPLVLSWRRREVRSATGVTVFSGMIGVTLFGLFHPGVLCRPTYAVRAPVDQAR